MIVYRKTLAEAVPPFLGALATLTSIMFLDRVFDLMDLFIRKGVALSTVLLIFAYTLPFILTLTTPMAALVAVLIVYGRMAAQSELLAARSLGVGLFRMTLGPLAGALALALALVWFSNTVLPESNFRLKNLLLDVNQKMPTTQLRSGVFNEVESFKIYASLVDVRTSTLHDVRVIDMSETPMKIVLARRGKMATVGDSVLLLTLYDGEAHEALRDGKTYRTTRFARYTSVIRLNTELIRKTRTYRSDREMTGAALLAEASKKRHELVNTTEGAQSRALKNRISQLMVEFHKKFAIPAAAVVFVLLGAPIAQRTKRSGYSAAFGLSFFVFVVYYVFLVAGEQMADKGSVPPGPAMWAADVLFLALGVVLFRRWR